MNISHLKSGGIVQLECGGIVSLEYCGNGIFKGRTPLGLMYWNERGYCLDSPTDTVEGYSRYNVRDIVEDVLIRDYFRPI